MRPWGFLAILALVLLLAGYVCWHLWRIAPGGGAVKLTVAGLFLLWMASLFVGFAVMEHIPVKAATVLYDVGNSWLAAFLYLLILFVLADVASLCHILPKALLKNSLTGLLSAVGIVSLVLVLGNIHYHHKYREELTVDTGKPLEKPLTIVLASDLHLGYHNRRAELARWVDLINAEHPDLVLFGGDVIDMSLRPVLEGDYGAELRRIEAPVWTVPGNHEYYGNVEGAARFFKQSGVLLLRDSVAHFNGVDVIGRNDRSGRRRAALKDLADGLSGFTLVLDHQPVHLEEAEEAGIDFQFSGHTHRGQLWPLTWVTDLLFEKSWGPLRRGHTQYYVSSGLGLWGPKFRIGSRSEYLVLRLQVSIPGTSPVQD